MADTVSLHRRERDGAVLPSGGTQRPVTYWAITVNGTALEDLMAGLQGGSSDSIGRLGHGDAEWREQALDELLGRSAPSTPSDRVPLLVCPECGDLGCGAVTARVVVDESFVRWEDFAYENGWAEPLPYPTVGPFTFDRTAYTTTITSGATDPPPATSSG